MTQLEWEGCFNARDLGGLRTADGRETVHGRIVRADALDRLTARGWGAASAHGLRTVIDLRNDDELRGDAAPRPESITTIHLPLDGTEDREFWSEWEGGPQFSTPLYYRPHLDRFPERNAAVLSAIARAGPGTVAIHCRGGRERTGQITMLLLALAGVLPEEIAADYALSDAAEDTTLPDAFLAERGTTAGELIISTLADLDVERYLIGAGVTPEDVAALRRRLLA